MTTLDFLTETTNQSSTTAARPQRHWKWFRRLLGVLLTLALAGWIYEQVAAQIDARHYPPPGRMVDVGGYQLHLYCTGAGSPTVVMDAGLGGWSLDWSRVQPDISRLTRVCTYDRAGSGWSQAGPQPRDAEQLVRELHTLLRNGAVAQPYVLVGHSNGGLRALLYAQRYPQEVAGLILVDPTHLSTPEESLAHLTPEEQAAFKASMEQEPAADREQGLMLFKVARMLRPFGVTRLLARSFLQQTPYAHLPPELQPAYRATFNNGAFISTFLGEITQVDHGIEQVRNQVRTLNNLPISILTDASIANYYGDPPSAPLPEQMLKLVQKIKWTTHQDMAALSQNSTHVLVQRSGHYIQLDRPDAVIAAVRAMVVQVR